MELDIKTNKITLKAARYYYVKQNKILRGNYYFFFLSGFSFTTIHESQNCKGRGRAFL